MGKQTPRPACAKLAKEAGKPKSRQASTQTLRRPASSAAVPAVQSASLTSSSSFTHVYPDQANNVWKYFVNGTCKGASIDPGTAATMAWSQELKLNRAANHTLKLAAEVEYK